MEVVPDGYIDRTAEEFNDNYIDMRQVTDFTVTENGFLIYLSNGHGYYWEKISIQQTDN